MRPGIPVYGVQGPLEHRKTPFWFALCSHIPLAQHPLQSFH